jgi:lipoprotein signal peptidase
MSVSSGHDASSAPVERSALRHGPSHLRLWLIAALGVAADLWTKCWAFDTLKPHETWVLIKDVCSLQRSLNPGALFGLGAGFAPIFVGASVLALLFVLYLFANTPSTRWSVHIALGLVLAGAIGNLYDRASQEAYVAYLPDGRRVIGLLDSQTDQGITISEYPDGATPRFYPGKPDPAHSGRQPVVRDFVKIELKIGGFSLWPWVFNVADALLVVGVAALLISFWCDRRRCLAAERVAGEQHQAE